MKIPYAKPSITQLEIDYVNDAVTNGWGEHRNSYIDRFEREFAEHLGVKYAIATSSCTGALHMGLSALGIGPGDDVILADTNWVATAAPIIHLGAQPVFVDIKPDSWCIDPEEVVKAITPKTQAIIATHLYGNLCEMDELIAIGQQHGIPIIEDAAEAIGSTYKGRRAGSIGNFGVYSFHGTKTITTGGEGGIFVTNESELYEAVLKLSNHGRSRTEKRAFWPEVVGFKFKMSNIQAAIGCAQLQRLDALVDRKREILSEYKLQFDQLGVRYWAFNVEPKWAHIGAWMSTVVLNIPSVSSNLADKVLAELNSCGIEARPFFAPLSITPPFVDQYRQIQVNSWSSKIYRVAINLPSSTMLTIGDIKHIVEQIDKVQHKFE
jgi:perosamine synthetase